MIFYVLLAFIIFLIISYQYKFINKSIFITPLAMSHLTFAISIVTVISLYESGNIPQNDFILLLWQQAIFLIFVLLTPMAIRKIDFNFSTDLHLKNIDFQATNVISLLAFLLLVIYIILLWGNYSSGDERLLLNRNLRMLSILKDLFVTWAIAILSLNYLITKRKKYLYLLVCLFSLVLFSGSKGSLLGGVLVFIFFYFQFNTMNNKTMIKLFLFLPIVLFLPSMIMTGEGFFEKIIYRIYMSADIYLLSYVIGDYKELIGYYDPLMYIIHPFSSMIGIRGYDFPLGAQILSTANLPVTGTGPNAHMTILNMIFFNNCSVCIIFASFIYGVIALISVYFAFKILKTKLDSYYKILFFIVLYTNQINLFTDIGMFEFNIIILFIGFCFFVLLEFLKKKYRRKLVGTN